MKPFRSWLSENGHALDAMRGDQFMQACCDYMDALREELQAPPQIPICRSCGFPIYAHAPTCEGADL